MHIDATAKRMKKYIFYVNESTIQNNESLLCQAESVSESTYLYKKVWSGMQWRGERDTASPSAREPPTEISGTLAAYI